MKENIWSLNQNPMTTKSKQISCQETTDFLPRKKDYPYIFLVEIVISYFFRISRKTDNKYFQQVYQKNSEYKERKQRRGNPKEKITITDNDKNDKSIENVDESVE